MSKTVEVSMGIEERSILEHLIFLIAILETSSVMKIVRERR